ncbi:uncharacterized protein BP5553_03726 [Venustampulla echinocandica]|uniref:Alpha/beta hydrolase fold-3 domain-containing protein n=1 Tax=Venustampulla echinocandica TaxID=2656787 RepID=A0A370TV37_9HELO|nr:uncharacterized protein BP5553_03726 [Venustampulla echinocandica]RDL39386.1 hypothetical protein BP5553_03726 [Venustampulla echinocandica]
MPLKSDIVFDAAKFDPANYSEQANNFNKNLIALSAKNPNWWDVCLPQRSKVGAVKYREMQSRGELAGPPPPVLPQGINFKIPSRDSGRDIPCRIMYPSSRESEEDRRHCKGTIMHIHGGGWVIGDESSYDTLIQFYANVGDLAVLSVGYRLAPENPFPKGPEDCQDVAEYLVKNSEKEYGGPLRFIGGESAGGHLSLLTTFHLLKTFPTFTLAGLLLHFGAYDLSHLPLYYNMTDAPIIPQIVSKHFIDAFLPNMSLEQRNDPSVSPMYEDLAPFRGRLPSALFTCGTVDPLLDDSVFMGTRWTMYGGETYIKIYTGAPHAFVVFPREMLKEAGEGIQDTKEYIELCMARV